MISFPSTMEVAAGRRFQEHYSRPVALHAPFISRNRWWWFFRGFTTDGGKKRRTPPGRVHCLLKAACIRPLQDYPSHTGAASVRFYTFPISYTNTDVDPMSSPTVSILRHANTAPAAFRNLSPIPTSLRKRCSILLAFSRSLGPSASTEKKQKTGQHLHLSIQEREGPAMGRDLLRHFCTVSPDRIRHRSVSRSQTS